MSAAVISYSSLTSAAAEASNTASKLERYSSGLSSMVYQKLTSCSWSSGNLSSAQSRVSGKMSQLQEKSAAFTTYSTALKDLKTQCQSVDTAVKNRVSTLTASFRSDHGISSNAVIDSIGYLLTYADDQCVLFRIGSNAIDEVGGLLSYITQSQEDWWDYEGGSDLIEAMVLFSVSAACAVCNVITAAGAVVAGSPVLLTIAGAVGVAVAVIALLNVGVDFANEIRSYYQTKYEEDPALGLIRSDENTIQDVLRTETSSTELHALADGIDIFITVGAIVSALGNLANFAKSASGWMTVNGTGEFSSGLDAFMSSLEKKYVTGEDVKVIKNWASLAKTIVKEDYKLYDTLSSEDYTFSDVVEAAADDSLLTALIWSNITLTTDVTYEDGTSGSKSISLSSLKNVVTSLKKIDSSTDSLYDLLYEGDSILGEELLQKLSEISEIEIRIPEIYIPRTGFDLDDMFAEAA